MNVVAPQNEIGKIIFRRSRKEKDHHRYTHIEVDLKKKKKMKTLITVYDWFTISPKTVFHSQLNFEVNAGGRYKPK